MNNNYSIIELDCSMYVDNASSDLLLVLLNNELLCVIPSDFLKWFIEAFNAVAKLNLLPFPTSYSDGYWKQKHKEREFRNIFDMPTSTLVVRHINVEHKFNNAVKPFITALVGKHNQPKAFLIKPNTLANTSITYSWLAECTVTMQSYTGILWLINPKHLKPKELKQAQLAVVR